ncbi:unnamed protein product [Allacma fusca]|uniref:Uncharacterized protein n=1 Tax=Allacma fusca TaxID=39272 RepID=A0A8J2P716_9HEXA|nr:unnamed protein product [Allacma fusca]
MTNIAGLFNSAKEYTEPVLGEVVEGSIPSWLEGTVIRVGPGIFDLEGGFTVNFYQDGFAVVAKIDIRDGKATFTQRFLESDAYKRAKVNKRPVYAEFGTRAYPDMSKNFFKRMFTTLVPTDLTDNNVGNVYLLENEVIVSSETCFVHSIDPATIIQKEKVCARLLKIHSWSDASHGTPRDGFGWNHVEHWCISDAHVQVPCYQDPAHWRRQAM